MKKNFFLLIGSGLMFVTTIMNGQQISPEVLQRFNPSIISKVFNVSSKLNLSQSDQLLLAKAYGLKDSLISVALKNGKSVSDIKDIDALSPVVSHYDSLMDQNKAHEAKIGYIKTKIDLLNQIKPLSNEQKKRISDIFMSKCKSADFSYGDAFIQALQNVIKDTIYYTNIYKADIKQKVSEATNAYPLKNNLPMAILKDSRGIIYKYQYGLITIDYAYPGASKEKISLVEAINEYYKPRIDSTLVRTGYFTPVTIFSSAIRQRKILKLTDNQVDQLNAKASELEKINKDYTLKNPDEVYNSDDFNHKNMMGILTENQYKIFIQLRLQKKTEKICADSWKEMIKYGLATKSDSVSTTKSLYFYNLQKLVTNDIYLDQPQVKASKLKDVEYFKPESIKQLEKAKRLAARNNSTKSSAKVETKTSFVW